MIDVPIILSAMHPKMRSALGFGKAEKANRSLDIDGRSLPLTWPNVWEKYRARWGLDEAGSDFGCVDYRASSLEKQD